MIKNVTVYCSSSQAIPDKYFAATRALASIFIEHNIGVVFGGGAVGLMGCMADEMIAGGGYVKGIMPHFMREVEWAHPKVQHFEFVEDMAQRKHRFLQGVDALITLPGGTGSYEELFEAISLKRLGKFFKPIIILNTDGFYDPIREQLRRCIEEKFMHPEHEHMWAFVDHPHEVIPAIRAARQWGADAIKIATLRQSK
ncbi:MAG: TIGR00730 family Rossman fold protein [Saprospiraceae bacterium]|nr:TIGR00730 family Rossman fold protein [Saprospiraceae bacterium]